MQEIEREQNRGIYSELLRNYSRYLVDQFVMSVKSHVPSAKTIDEITVENSLHEFLETMAEIISTDDHENNEVMFSENIRVSRLHGVSRAEIPAYTLDQVITEYRILRDLIFNLFENEEGPLQPIERDKVLFAIDNGMIQAATEFAMRRGFSEARFSEEVLAKKDAQKRATELESSMTKMEQQEKLRDKFVSSVSHDMRNPLFIAKASAELIKKHQTPESINKNVEKILRNLDRANLMIKDLLDSNRIKSGDKLPLQKIDCNLTELLSNIKEDLAHVYGARFIYWPGKEVHAHLDPIGLRRAIENLIINAVKYGASDRPITISLVKNKDDLRINVHNEGNAISVDDQAKLFDMYHRSDDAKKSSQQGWGIGLTLVKGIADSHNGSVEVRSSTSEGTTFTIILPLQ